MGIANGILFDGAQPEPLIGIVGCLLEAPIIKDERLGLGIFKIKFAVIGPLNGVREMAARVAAVYSGALKERHGG
jgi:hypothetical protein